MDSHTSPVRGSAPTTTHEKCLAPQKARNPRLRGGDSNYASCAVETCSQQFMNWLNLDGNPRHNMCENCVYKYYMVDKNEYDKTSKYY